MTSALRPHFTKLLGLAFLFISVSLHAASPKEALLIANGKYSHFAGLAHPPADAEKLQAALEQLGFHVRVVRDGNREEMLEAISEFERGLRNTGAIAFFHYGGHGVQVDGKNYLLPADADIPDERRVATRAVALDEVMTAMDAAAARASIIVIDACRDNPLPAGSGRNLARGLSVVGLKPKNSIVIYAAEAGSKAWDGVFTPIFSSAIQLQNISIDRVMKIVRGEVSKNTNGEQIPGEYNQLFEDIYLGGNQEETKLPIIKESPSELKITDELITQFYKALRTDFEKILETTSGQNSQASKQPQPPFSFQWGETFSRVEQSLSNFSKSADIKITGIEYDDQKKFMYVEGIPQKNLHKTIFVFFADKLVGIQLNYSSLNWSEDQFQSFFKQVKENCDSKYGKGVALNKESQIVNNMVMAYDSIQWAGKNTGVGLFLFSAKENDQKFNTLILRYNKK